MSSSSSSSSKPFSHIPDSSLLTSPLVDLDIPLSKFAPPPAPTKSEDPNVKYVGAFDVGTKNPAFGYGHRGQFLQGPAFCGTYPHIETSSVLITSNGDVYADYEERYAPEFARRWCNAHWYIIKRLDLMQIERQMALPGENKYGRACVVLAITIYTTLKTMVATLGYGPVVVMVDPKSWKRGTGVPSTGSHAGNKKASIEKLQERIPKEIYARYSKIGGGKMDDVADVYHMIDYGTANFDVIVKSAAAENNHQLNLFENKMSIRKQDRKDDVEMDYANPPSNPTIHAYNRVKYTYKAKLAQDARTAYMHAAKQRKADEKEAKEEKRKAKAGSKRKLETDGSEGSKECISLEDALASMYGASTGEE